MINHFVAFLDILGFSEIVKADDSGKKVEFVLKTVEKAFQNPDEEYTVEHVMLSDTIFLYVPSGQDRVKSFKPLRRLCYVVHQLQSKCALEDIWIRGAISHGPLKETKVGAFKNVFGKALIEAYKNERKANYPRVLISSSVLQKVNSGSIPYFIGSLCDHDENPFTNNLIFRWNESPDYFKEDCISYIDYLMDMNFDELSSIIRIVKDRLKNSPIDIYPKYSWLKTYLRVVVDVSKTLKPNEKERLYTQLSYV